MHNYVTLRIDGSQSPSTDTQKSNSLPLYEKSVIEVKGYHVAVEDQDAFQKMLKSHPYWVANTAYLPEGWQVAKSAEHRFVFYKLRQDTKDAVVEPRWFDEHPMPSNHRVIPKWYAPLLAEKGGSQPLEKALQVLVQTLLARGISKDEVAAWKIVGVEESNAGCIMGLCHALITYPSLDPEDHAFQCREVMRWSLDQLHSMSQLYNTMAHQRQMAAPAYRVLIPELLASSETEENPYHEACIKARWRLPHGELVPLLRKVADSTAAIERGIAANQVKEKLDIDQIKDGSTWAELIETRMTCLQQDAQHRPEIVEEVLTSFGEEVTKGVESPKKTRAHTSDVSDGNTQKFTNFFEEKFNNQYDEDAQKRTLRGICHAIMGGEGDASLTWEDAYSPSFKALEGDALRRPNYFDRVSGESQLNAFDRAFSLPWMSSKDITLKDEAKKLYDALEKKINALETDHAKRLGLHVVLSRAYQHWRVMNREQSSERLPYAEVLPKNDWEDATKIIAAFTAGFEDIGSKITHTWGLADFFDVFAGSLLGNMKKQPKSDTIARQKALIEACRRCSDRGDLAETDTEKIWLESWAGGGVSERDEAVTQAIQSFSQFFRGEFSTTRWAWVLGNINGLIKKKFGVVREEAEKKGGMLPTYAMLKPECIAVTIKPQGIALVLDLLFEKMGMNQRSVVLRQGLTQAFYDSLGSEDAQEVKAGQTAMSCGGFALVRRVMGFWVQLSHCQQLFKHAPKSDHRRLEMYLVDALQKKKLPDLYKYLAQCGFFEMKASIEQQYLYTSLVDGMPESGFQEKTIKSVIKDTICPEALGTHAYYHISLIESQAFAPSLYLPFIAFWSKYRRDLENSKAPCAIPSAWEKYTKCRKFSDCFVEHAPANLIQSADLVTSLKALGDGGPEVWVKHPAVSAINAIKAYNNPDKYAWIHGEVLDPEDRKDFKQIIDGQWRQSLPETEPLRYAEDFWTVVATLYERLGATSFEKYLVGSTPAQLYALGQDSERLVRYDSHRRQVLYLLYKKREQSKKTPLLENQSQRAEETKTNESVVLSTHSSSLSYGKDAYEKLLDDDWHELNYPRPSSYDHNPKVCDMFLWLAYSQKMGQWITPPKYLLAKNGDIYQAMLPQAFQIFQGFIDKFESLAPHSNSLIQQRIEGWLKRVEMAKVQEGVRDQFNKIVEDLSGLDSSLQPLAWKVLAEDLHRSPAINSQLIGVIRGQLFEGRQLPVKVTYPQRLNACRVLLDSWAKWQEHCPHLVNLPSEDREYGVHFYYLSRLLQLDGPEAIKSMKSINGRVNQGFSENEIGSILGDLCPLFGSLGQPVVFTLKAEHGATKAEVQQKVEAFYRQDRLLSESQDFMVLAKKMVDDNWMTTQDASIKDLKQALDDAPNLNELCQAMIKLQSRLCCHWEGTDRIGQRLNSTQVLTCAAMLLKTQSKNKLASFEIAMGEGKSRMAAFVAMVWLKSKDFETNTVVYCTSQPSLAKRWANQYHDLAKVLNIEIKSCAPNQVMTWGHSSRLTLYVMDHVTFALSHQAKPFEGYVMVDEADQALTMLPRIIQAEKVNKLPYPNRVFVDLIKYCEKTPQNLRSLPDFLEQENYRELYQDTPDLYRLLQRATAFLAQHKQWSYTFNKAGHLLVLDRSRQQPNADSGEMTWMDLGNGFTQFAEAKHYLAQGKGGDFTPSPWYKNNKPCRLDLAQANFGGIMMSGTLKHAVDHVFDVPRHKKSCIERQLLTYDSYEACWHALEEAIKVEASDKKGSRGSADEKKSAVLILLPSLQDLEAFRSQGLRLIGDQAMRYTFIDPSTAKPAEIEALEKDQGQPYAVSVGVVDHLGVGVDIYSQYLKVIFLDINPDKRFSSALKAQWQARTGRQGRAGMAIHIRHTDAGRRPSIKEDERTHHLSSIVRAKQDLFASCDDLRDDASQKLLPASPTLIDLKGKQSTFFEYQRKIQDTFMARVRDGVKLIDGTNWTDYVQTLRGRAKTKASWKHYAKAMKKTWQNKIQHDKPHQQKEDSRAALKQNQIAYLLFMCVFFGVLGSAPFYLRSNHELWMTLLFFAGLSLVLLCGSISFFRTKRSAVLQTKQAIKELTKIKEGSAFVKAMSNEGAKPLDQIWQSKVKAMSDQCKDSVQGIISQFNTYVDSLGDTKQDNTLEQAKDAAQQALEEAESKLAEFREGKVAAENVLETNRTEEAGARHAYQKAFLAYGTKAREFLKAWDAGKQAKDDSDHLRYVEALKMFFSEDDSQSDQDRAPDKMAACLAHAIPEKLETIGKGWFWSSSTDWSKDLTSLHQAVKNAKNTWVEANDAWQAANGEFTTKIDALQAQEAVVQKGTEVYKAAETAWQQEQEKQQADHKFKEREAWLNKLPDLSYISESVSAGEIASGGDEGSQDLDSLIEKFKAHCAPPSPTISA